jgi:DNA-binding MarR family transcriptional regulator
MSPPILPFEATLHVRDSCLCLHTQRAARTLARRFDAALRPVGLTNEQFSLLMALNRPEPPHMAEIANLLGADRTTLTAALKPLVRRGLASISVDAGDARIRRVGLTGEGHRRLIAGLPLWTEAHATLEAELGDADPARLRRDLTILSAPRRDVPPLALDDMKESAA